MTPSDIAGMELHVIAIEERNIYFCHQSAL